MFLEGEIAKDGRLFVLNVVYIKKHFATKHPKSTSIRWISKYYILTWLVSMY